MAPSDAARYIIYTQRDSSCTNTALRCSLYGGVLLRGGRRGYGYAREPARKPAREQRNATRTQTRTQTRTRTRTRTLTPLTSPSPPIKNYVGRACGWRSCRVGGHGGARADGVCAASTVMGARVRKAFAPRRRSWGARADGVCAASTVMGARVRMAFVPRRRPWGRA
jgi:hypothetical protein